MCNGGKVHCFRFLLDNFKFLDFGDVSADRNLLSSIVNDLCLHLNVALWVLRFKDLFDTFITFRLACVFVTINEVGPEVHFSSNRVG